MAKLNSSQATRKAPKSKLGCRTCKLRKVKCDEARPTCKRCQLAGRACDGYGVWGGEATPSDLEADLKRLSTSPGLAKTLPFMSLLINEQGCFDWYLCRSAVKLPGVFRNDSWTALVYQASTTEPAIRYAVLSLASAHKEEVLACKQHDEQTIFTVRQYSRAISNLRIYLSDQTKTSVRTTLIACVLFTNMEFLRGSYTNGLLHLKYGLDLLREIPNDTTSTYLDGWLVTMFTRLLVQARLFGQLLEVPSQHLLLSLPEPDLGCFRSIHHARRSLENIVLHIFDGLNWHDQSDDSLSGRINISFELQKWMINYEASLARSKSIMESFTYRLLQLYHRVAVILQGICITGSGELSIDRHEADFLSIVVQCIEMYKMIFPNGKRTTKGLHDPEPTSPNSISDIGWIAPLYFSAINCRNPRLRCQAANLLLLVPHKEGIFSATLAAAVAQQVIDIEQDNFYDDFKNIHLDKLSIPTSHDLTYPPLPKDRRISNLRIVLPADKTGKLLMRCHRNGALICKEYDLPSGKWTDITTFSYSLSTQTSDLLSPH